MRTKPQRHSGVRLLATGAILVVLAAYLAVSAVVHVFPFPSSHAGSGHNGQLRLLLPADLSHNENSCDEAQSPSQWSVPGLVQALHCTDPGLAGGNVYAYQSDSTVNFQAAWRNFNQWWGFRGDAGSTCPPKAAGQGVTMSSGTGPDQADRQVTECGMMLSGNGHVPAYAWDLPNSKAFFVVQGAPGSSFSALDSWLSGPATPPFSVPDGVDQLAALLPSGIADPAVACRPLDSPWDWDLPGLVRDLECTDPNLPNGQVYAFQLSSTADYLTSWQNFNKWWGYDISKAGPGCPPSGHASQGTQGWSTARFPARSGQVVECGRIGSGASAVPAFAYAMPGEDAFFIVQGQQGTNFTMLNTWWSNASMPAVSPGPA
jgi:hypothetical protein